MRVSASGQKNLAAGFMYIGIAVFFGAQSFSLGIGKVSQMGPGFFPLMLSAALAVVGIATMFTREGGDGKIGTVAWKNLAFILAGPVSFFLLVTGAGFLPAIWVAVYIPTHAATDLRRRTALILTTVFALVSWILFTKVLGLPIRTFGRWFGN